jgi:cobalt-zinc-cadmium efflux system membrane fusion protein
MSRSMCALAMMFVIACREEAPDATEHSSAPTDPGAMCAEHGVLEALCTKCNPSLVAVFRARGDYCEEHGFPESICPECHPERGGRPAGAIAIDEAPADGTRVRLASAELANGIGLTTVPAEAAPALIDVPATGRIVYDPARVARLNPRSPGVVSAIAADLGAAVEPGDPLVTIASAEVGADRTRLAAARSRLDAAEATLRRQGELEGIVSERQRLEAQRERDEAQGELAALGASLRLVGGARGSEYTLSSPIAGVVTARSGTIGAFVGTEEVLVEVVDPSRVFAEIDVPEDELGRIAPGASVVVRSDALGERAFEGTLSYLAPAIDPHTRTALGRIALENADRALRANMFVNALVRVPRDEPAVIVPRAAVQHARGATLVFVRVADELYEARRVEVVERPAEPDRVEVRGRVAAGERVVVEGAFLLRTETLRDSIGAGCCEGEEPGGG